MTGEQLVKFAKRAVTVWRKRFRLDSRWDIDVVYSSEQDEEDNECSCYMNDDKASYWKLKLVFYPAALEYKSENTIRTKVNNVVCHELGHILLWHMSSYAKNVLNSKLWDEFLKHEEQVVSLLEEIFTNQKPKQGVKLTWGSR